MHVVTADLTWRGFSFRTKQLCRPEDNDSGHYTCTPFAMKNSAPLTTKRFATTLAVLIVSPALCFFLTRNGAANAASIVKPFTVENIPGALAPLGIFDPENLSGKADKDTLKRYREAELVHGRVAILAAVGFLVGEAVEGSSFLYDASVSGPAITHLTQVPIPFWTALALLIAYFEIDRAKYAFVEPEDVPLGQPGLMRAEHIPGDIGFDP
jgi:Chlorophyll A-B binding protein